MALLFANNASSKLATGISASDVSVVVTTGEGAKFPTITGGDTFKVTVQDSTGAYEIMLCTARTSDTMTVTRAQEGTSARAFSAGATVANRFTAGTMSGYAQTSAVQPLDATLTALAGVTTAANKLIYATGADAFTTTDITAAARTILDDASTSDMRTTLGLAIGTNVQAYDADTCISDVAKAYTAQHIPTVYRLTSASTIAFDNALTAYASVTLGENAVLGDPSNKADGQAGEIVVTGASTYTLGVHANWKMADGTAVALAPIAGKKTWIWWECNGTYNYITQITQEA